MTKGGGTGVTAGPDNHGDQNVVLPSIGGSKGGVLSSGTNAQNTREMTAWMLSRLYDGPTIPKLDTHKKRPLASISQYNNGGSVSQSESARPSKMVSYEALKSRRRYAFPVNSASASAAPKVPEQAQKATDDDMEVEEGEQFKLPSIMVNQLPTIVNNGPAVSIRSSVSTENNAEKSAAATAAETRRKSSMVSQKSSRRSSKPIPGEPGPMYNLVSLAELGSNDPLDFIARISKIPNCMEFVYMMPAKQDNGSYNPYHLQIMDYQHIERGNFFTLSAKGVTHFINGMASFTTLPQWEREFKLFNQIVKIPYFAKYRISKCYSAWRKYVRTKKLTLAKRNLSENLFCLNQNLRTSLFRVREVCQEFKGQRFHDIKAEQTYDLAPMIKEHEDCLRRVLQGFTGFRTSVERLVIEGCENYLIKAGFEPVYSKKKSIEEVAAGDQDNGGRKTGSAGSNRSNGSNPGSANNAGNGGQVKAKMTYTEMAAKRKACLRLQRFVKLADYLIIGALHNVAIISLNDLLGSLFRYLEDSDVDMETSEASHLPMAETATSELVNLLEREAFYSYSEMGVPQTLRRQAIRMRAQAVLEIIRSRPSMKDNMEAAATHVPIEGCIPLYRTELLLTSEAENNTLIFSPSLDDFVNSLERVSKSFVNVVESFPLLASTIVYIEKKDLLDEASFSDGPSIFHIVIEDPFYQVLYSRIKGTIIGNFAMCLNFSQSFERYLKMYRENLAITLEGLEATELSLEYFENALAKYAQQRQDMEAIKTRVEVGNLLVDSSSLQKELLPSPIRCFGYLEQLLPRMAHRKNESLLNELNQSIRILRSNPSSVEGFVENLNHLDLVKGNISSIEERVEEIIKLYNLVESYSVGIAPTELALYQTLVPTVRQLKDAIEVCDDTKEENIQKFTFELEKNISDMINEVNDIRNRSQDPMILNPASTVESVMSFLDELHGSISKLQVLSENYVSYQKVFKIPASKFSELEETMNDIQLKKTLWTSFEQWDTLVKNWKSLPFDKLDVEELNTKILTYLKIVVQLEKGLPPNDVVPKLRGTVEEFRQIYPTIVDLRNGSLKARHWDKIQDVIGKVIVKDETFTLGHLQELNVFQFKDDISAVSSQASSEAALEDMLSKVVKAWAEIEFTILPYRDYKDVFILGGVDEISTQLEDSQVTIATIRGSRFMGPIKGEVEKWDKQLTLFSETLDEWITCQRNWLYLESIFSAPDIQRQLPDESKMFSQVDRSWKDIMRKTHRNPLAIKAGTTPGLLESLQQNNQLLEKIQKCLEEYLESKRLLFPRFYFLSNDELLEILAQTRNPLAVQPHLSKCFDAIKSLEFSNEPKSIDILAMLSPEGERLPFTKLLKARGNVESWLSTVEESMYGTVRRAIKNALSEYDKMAAVNGSREDWILNQPGQVVLAGSQLIWCREVSECLKARNVPIALSKFRDKSIANLNRLAGVVRGKLTKLQRGKLGALITIEVHARDIVAGLINAKASSVNDFEWLKQLRYYWEGENDSCLVRMTTSVFEYGYEYLGCSARLVITPLTDRCYLTLTSAISLNLGGSPLGPAGTGKTETVKDLAKAIAKQCVVFNCSDALDYKMMGKFFAGLAQSGAWCCFDEFNRIDIEVLSVIAQQLLTIKRAKDGKVSRFMFEGKDIRLISTCCAFITMNPGYAGRTELPDNLKALFRPIAMMIPDYGLIAEIILFSEGFEQAKTLSRKLVNLYKLCSEQLSQQDHYDFGMRAVKSSVTMAGSLKRGSPDLVEEVALIRSLRDSNLPKFLADDIPLFKGILSDLFPGIVVPPLDYGELLKAIEGVMDEKHLEPVGPFIDRIIQLYETMKVRHGVMLVGPSGSGKTTNYEVLAGALTKLRENSGSNAVDQTFQKVKTFVLNPKCITMAH